tara:strand:+ start:1197 stop:1556 length:360 start_codon:yes stop_codon:yes gene_type:complete
MVIINRIENDVVYSDTEYPDWTNDKYYKAIPLEKEYVENMLQQHFNAKRIANKYAIKIPNNKIFYQHDNKTWLLKEKDNVFVNLEEELAHKYFLKKYGGLSLWEKRLIDNKKLNYEKSI